jgi:uncharacterized cupin superfamily protein
MHRTLSIDFGVVLSGSIQCVLDSGEAKDLNVGDVVVQRGTNHVSGFWGVNSLGLQFTFRIP